MKKTYQFVGALALVILLVPQVKHTVYIFQNNSQHEDVWFAWCYAIGIDLAILIFTLKGWTWTAVGYLLATLGTNIVYQFFPVGMEAKILLSVLLSVTIFIFSHLYKKEQEQVEKSTQKNDILDKVNELGISIQVNPYKCPSCGKGYQTSKELNGHISGHKASKKLNDWTPDQYGDWEKENELRAKFTLENIERIEKILRAA
ncbi:C2H2-type zinc finger protein [Fulvivirgaceae bacterium BMA10]|uniref:C2H2-type zinc finger protein n=1 Tax=Splendidivirga corallicola TaxID=3051826 RepID=A0ABT8KKB6_9BACT|nr:C2H2-type zinc finger protein [Fulvivirgaceae bacterium BMA10]